ncbi:MATE family efflux transporter [Sediminispirochaeta bajacaliforniensis]|uniref:MATE family efflux transporter n=1 Tax=Sediminispirochaeta bajacaliforniensis TaxID=148 RepID=UPI000382E9DE|nr:MATE family efflux transporter [Sediminispirochaeta bajacaliforniensis]
MNSSDRILNGGISRLFVRLSFPAIVSLLSLGLYQFVDGIFVGQWVGPAALGAVGVVYPFSLINNGIFSLIGVGAASMLSRAIGRKDQKTIDALFGNLLLANLILSGAMILFGLLAAESIVAFLGATGEIHRLGVIYLRILVLGSFFFNFASSANILIRAEGRMRQAMRIMLSGTILNIILDALFLGVFGWGIAGAASATVISQGVMCCVSFFYFGKANGAITLRKSHIAFTGHLFEMLRVGFSGMALPIMTVIQIVFVLKSVASYGTEQELIIIGAVIKILNFIFVPIWGICQGFQPLAGMNYGAGTYKRLARAFALFSFYSTIITLVIWLLIQLFPRVPLGWFIIDSDVLEAGVSVIRLYLCDFPVYGYMLLVITFFQAIGRSIPAAFLVVSRMSLFFIPVILLLPRVLGLAGVWLATPVSDIFVVVIGTILFGLELRRQRRLEAQGEKR